LYFVQLSDLGVYGYIQMMTRSVSSQRFSSARFMCMDLKDFYYGHAHGTIQYVRLRLESSLRRSSSSTISWLATSDGWVYIEIRKGMPGLKQAGRLRTTVSQTPRQVRLHPSSPRSLPLKHHTRDIVFALVVDDFGSGTPIRTTPPPPRAQQMMPSQRLVRFLFPQHHSRWDYIKRTIQLSMRLHPAALARFHIPCQYPTHSPLLLKPQCTAPKYNMRRIHQIRPSSTPRERTLQRVIGVALCGPNASTPLNATMGTLGSEQARTKDATPNPSTPGFHGHHHNPRSPTQK
jgi:hypothetical protein